MRGWIAALLALGFVLAGCLSSSGSDDAEEDEFDQAADSGPAQPGERDATVSNAPIASLRPVTVVDCRLNPFAFPAEGEKVRAQVPAPYAAGNGTVGSLGLEVYACDRVVVDNETVLTDVSFAWTLIPVEPPDAWAGPPGTQHVFVTELFLPEVLTDVFAGRGLQPTVATVTTEEGEGVAVVVEVEDSILYEAIGYGRSNQPVSHSVATRMHFAVGDGFRWIDDNATLELMSLPDTVHLAAAGGTLGAVSPAAGQLVGQSTPGNYAAVWTFGGPS